MTSLSLPTFPLSPVVMSSGTLVVPFRNLARSISSTPQPPLDLTWSIASADRGRTFSAPSFVADCGSRWSSVAADASTGPYKDRIYLTCWDRAMEHLYLFTSNDAGSSWSPPMLVSRGYVQNGMVAVTIRVSLASPGTTAATIPVVIALSSDVSTCTSLRHWTAAGPSCRKSRCRPQRIVPTLRRTPKRAGDGWPVVTTSVSRPPQRAAFGCFGQTVGTGSISSEAPACA